jgi:hypothetical protein
MPRLQVYLPDDLYRELKERGLPASELLQEAVRAELQRLDLCREADGYVQALAREVGEPSHEETARAEAIARRIARRGARRTG